MQLDLLTYRPRKDETWTESTPPSIPATNPPLKSAPPLTPMSPLDSSTLTAVAGSLGAECERPSIISPFSDLTSSTPTFPSTTATVTELPEGFVPRAWQAEAVPLTVEELLDPGYVPGIWEVCTGSGKTVALCWLLWELWQRGRLPDQVVVVTSRTDLVADFCEVLQLFFPAEMIGRWDGHRKRKGRVLVTTYPSLPRVIGKLGAVGLLCCDEVHRSSARGVRATIEAIPLRFGMSATPFLGDKARRIVGFERVIYTLTRADAEAQSIIVPLEVVWLENPIIEGEP